jgi:ABC-type cobalamin transport system permease subunit
VAASLSWTWSGALVWWSTKANGFTQMTLLCSVVAVWSVVRLDDDPLSRRDWLMLGAALGLGWWQSPQIILLGVPAVLWLLVRLVRRQWPVPPA